jgi:septation ring formation regulator EzrA
MPTSLLIFFMIIVGIPVIGGIGYAAFERWLKHKEKMTAALNAQTAEKAAQYAAHTERLEQRVRVLERIATDKGMDLSDEIERLRDERPVN